MEIYGNSNVLPSNIMNDLLLNNYFIDPQEELNAISSEEARTDSSQSSQSIATEIEDSAEISDEAHDMSNNEKSQE